MIKLSEEDLKELLRLHNLAQTTPVIKFSSDPKEKDLSTKAYDNLQEFQKKMGAKYDYNWMKFAINGKGEVISLEEARASEKKKDE